MPEVENRMSKAEDKMPDTGSKIDNIPFKSLSSIIKSPDVYQKSNNV